MARRLRISSLKHRARHVRRQSHTVRHARLQVTLWILAALLVALGVYGVTQYRRLHDAESGVEVVVGNALMARLELEDGSEPLPVLDALRDVSVRPTSRQTILFRGEEFELALTAEDALAYCFEGAPDGLRLLDGEGRVLGVVTSVYLPTDEDALRQME